MLHITFSMHLVLSGSAWSPSDFSHSRITGQKRFCIHVASWLLLFYVLLSEDSEEQLVCDAYTLDCGHPTVRHCSSQAPMAYSGLNSYVRGRFQGSLSIQSFAPPQYKFSKSTKARAKFYQ